MADKAKFRVCQLFRQTAQDKFKSYPGLKEKLDAFMSVKKADPMATFGSRDGMFAGGGNFTAAVPKLRHAHMTHDVSIFYRLSGANPTVIDLFGLFSHDESGTGQPANIKKQKSLAKSLANQDFS
jgi:hypothetical protein